MTYFQKIALRIKRYRMKLRAKAVREKYPEICSNPQAMLAEYLIFGDYQVDWFEHGWWHHKGDA